MTETQILINVTNTGDKNQTFHVELFDSSGYLVEIVDKDLLLKGQESREINVIMNATSSELTKLAVTLSLSGKALQTITRTFMVTEVFPPSVTIDHKTSDCAAEIMKYYNCSQQQWEAQITIVLPVNKGNCCFYRVSLLATDVRENIIRKTFDFSGGAVFNTTDVDLALLTKPNIKQSKTPQTLKTSNFLLYIGIGTGVCCLILAVVLIIVIARRTKSKKV
ncbi:uncharacterized protein LOC130047368 isoform X3 [Ostrea edulis]|uniref:uncharacterized protein LOC130047368 isoform X3 n=1 Tax=Ostrea edulis TaxID=37623 RepID=UPI0024AEAC96|nr:uncharacterized protein LOC130047368 isoform X3 [Ostrea edulis]